MTLNPLKSSGGLIAGILLASGAITVATGQPGNADDLTPQEIIKKSQAVYASLTSYSDQGKTTSSIGSTLVAPHTFTVKLERPNLYRIEWTQNNGFYVNKGTVWCAGGDNFMETDGGGNAKPTKCTDKEMALGGATGISGGAAASIPGTFFKMHWGDQLGRSMQSATRKTDERSGDTDCYVLTQRNAGRTVTLWIGKQDHLIRQIENDTKAAELQAMMDANAAKHPEMHLPTSVGGDCKSIETHSNIVVNKPLAEADFDK